MCRTARPVGRPDADAGAMPLAHAASQSPPARPLDRWRRCRSSCRCCRAGSECRADHPRTIRRARRRSRSRPRSGTLSRTVRTTDRSPRSLSVSGSRPTRIRSSSAVGASTAGRVACTSVSHHGTRDHSSATWPTACNAQATRNPQSKISDSRSRRGTCNAANRAASASASPVRPRASSTAAQPRNASCRAVTTRTLPLWGGGPA
jgi:hypothetical protein